jgi:F1F0 ATPase subunit 2
MIMIEILNFVGSLGVGILIGAIFFGGLWWTIRKAVGNKQIAPLFFVSRMMRMSLALIGFYFVARGHWQNLVVCLIGFMIARFVIMRLTAIPEVGHATHSR